MLGPCVAASCQVIPFPDPDTGLVYQPEEGSSLSLQSEFTVYNPKIKPKFQMNFPGPNFCKGNGDIMLIVGIYPMVNKPSILYFLYFQSFSEEEKAFSSSFCN